MKFTRYIVFGAALVVMAACNDNKFSDVVPFPDPVEQEQPDDEEDQTVVSSRDEQYRPQVHYTPSKNWMNDPNGMVYANGVWHLYYQYNPKGNNWGNMSWGHATSTDLIHWDEKAVAMTPNEYGDIFSGSAICDLNNVAGFGGGAILAFYTASGEHQQQCLAYSTDGGITFTQYSGNPIIKNNDIPDFRDPKVFYHEESGKYVMVLAKGWDHSVDIWGSSNLKDWNKLSEFRVDNARFNIGQWECPDLIRLPYNGGEKWVMIVSTNPGGPAGGSGTAYFTGSFNGTEFVADEAEYPRWLDYGSDNYAGVTWSNSPDGRVLFIGWMNNWAYCGDVPCSPWRSAMTLPRELTLVESNGLPTLTSKVVTELDGIAGAWQEAPNGVCSGGNAYEMVVNLNPKQHHTFSVGNSIDERVEVELIPSVGKIVVNRSGITGNANFHVAYPISSISAPYNTEADNLELHLYVDSSSVEIISGDGTISITSLVYPSVPYDRISGVSDVTYRALSSIWK